MTDIARLQDRLRKKELSTAEASTAMRVRNIARARDIMNVLKTLGFVKSEERKDWSGVITFWRFCGWSYDEGHRPLPTSAAAGRRAAKMAEITKEVFEKVGCPDLF